MKRLLVVLGAGLLLAGCGLISSPPINNPFNIDGKTVSVPLAASVQATGSATASATFEDLTSIPNGPTGFDYSLAIKSVSFSGAGCPATIPATINVTMSATLTLSDGSGASARNSSATANNVSFTLTTSGGTTSVSNLTANTISVNLGTALPILQNGGTNTAALVANITTVSTPDLANCTMNLTWGGGSGVVKL